MQVEEVLKHFANYVMQRLAVTNVSMHLRLTYEFHFFRILKFILNNYTYFL